MKLRDQLLLSFSALVLVAAVGLGLGVVVVKQLSRVSDQIVEGNLTAIEASARMRTLVGAQQSELSRYLLENGPNGQASLVPMMSPFVSEARGILHDLRRRATSEDELLAVASSEQALAALAQLTLAYDGASAQGNRIAERELQEALTELRLAARLPYESNFKQLVSRSSQVAADARQLGLVLSLVAAAMIVLGMLAALHLARRLSRPLEAVDVAMARIGRGDYGARLAPAHTEEIDRVSRGFNAMAASLQRFHAMRLDEIVAERRRLDTVIDSIDQGLVMLDADGGIERINPVAGHLLGLDARSACRRSAREVFAGSSLPARIEEALRQPGPETHDDSNGRDIKRTVDGHEVTLAWSLTPYWHGDSRGLLLMLRDVSQERALERMRTEFVLRAAHELRTPVTGMRMAVGLLQDRLNPAPDSREAELLETLESEMARTARLIANLLDLARLYNQRLSLMPAPIPPSELVESAAERFRDRAKQVDVQLETAVEPALPEVCADRDQIDRLLDNLLSNALRHTPPKGTVTLRAHRLGQELVVEVSDTGEGLDRAQRERVFEPFVQVGRATGGSGIGLAMSREIAEQHGGGLRAETAREGGCRFVLSLPL
jgi:two-component system, NtrC family, sensor histidine kinase KinB